MKIFNIYAMATAILCFGSSNALGSSAASIAQAVEDLSAGAISSMSNEQLNPPHGFLRKTAADNNNGEEENTANKSDKAANYYGYNVNVDLGNPIPNEFVVFDYGQGNTAASDHVLSVTSHSSQNDGARFRSVKKLQGAFRVSGKVKAAAAANQQSTSGMLTSFYTSTLEGSHQQNEIDFEFLGKNTYQVQTNYYVHGQGGHEQLHDLGFDSRSDFHTYTIEADTSGIRWFIDGRLVREEKGINLVSEPTYLYSSLWDAGRILPDWAGYTNWGNGPFTASYRDLVIQAESTTN